ncbi:arginine utilization protein RocB [Melghirimyces profundicolus]|uniref:Arginine utilization protein RocB n=2 Tax=Melghirimyces profundicolus TaxID=1242148 RepID=A0A2T6C9R9_9BACL|nr:M20/M25/M40 family metallo-hydrolase [Melghirimyces profundicolus]PTX65013.1 arginine utilization protein RocB [Melghirimyces profundicolus]
MKQWKDEVLELTKELVHHPSVNGTIGERDIAYRIYDYFKELKYFKENPHHLRLVKTLRDERERYNVLALVKGGDAAYRETVILMGHMDTVGVEDFGKWKRLAFSSDELMERWKGAKIPEKVKRDLESGEWACGRGSVDMKSGVAANMVLTRYFTEHPEELKGNLLFLSECDEEDNSHGILSALSDFLHLAREEDLSYIAAINADYTSPRYEGDPNRYVYLGTVGKLLPAFFIAGKETHVGQAFEGFDPNLVASELTRRLDYNPDFCDEMYGETTLPPVSLKQTDLKLQYDVQTPLSAFVYYNFFVHSWSPKDVLEKLKKVAWDAMDSARKQYQKRYGEYCARTGDPHQPPNWVPRVYTYEELYNECAEKYGSEFEESMRLFAMNLLNEEELDLRDYCRRMTEELWSWDEEKTPAVVLFYASIYIPRIVLNEEEERDQRLIQAVERAVESIQPDCPHPIRVRNFFPYISDMSFVAISDDQEGLDSLEKNMPAWGTKHQMDVDAIRALDVPVVNIGPYGMDAHKQWERVEVPYSMEVVPNLNYQVIKNLLGA